ncbi:hypothetical protein PV797_14475 [Clostridiaceae bacterium M8S5]|nr:hypothetical protein PV797_14475 [Clostridiaceae bacterium M8S5]
MKTKILIVGLVALSTMMFSACDSADSNKKEDSNGKQESNISQNIDKEGKPKAKIAVNISGKITEISKDGNKIKVGDKWVIIDENTRFEDDPDNGIKPVPKDFEIGNEITGYTEDDLSKEEVRAINISSNKKSK